MRRSACIAGLALVLLAYASGCGQKQARFKVGEELPRFILPDLNGNKVTAPDDFKGKVVIIRFWANWCSACAKEVPAIDYVYYKYKNKGVAVIAVNVGQPREVADAFVKNLKVTYPVLLDPFSVTKKQFGLTRLPTIFILDRNGVVKAVNPGEGEREMLEKTVAGLL